MATRFDKKPLTHDQQLELLESRGLVVPDRPFAIHCLRHLNYYRLSAYRFPLTEIGNPDRFLPGATFQQLWTLYDFDQTMRRLVLDATKRIEVSVRPHWAYTIGHRYGPFCYEDPRYFANAAEHGRGLAKLSEELSHSKEDFVKHFKRKYGISRPPVWAVCEVLSLGQFSRFYQNLKDPSARKEVAAPYGIDESVLTSYLNHLTVVRNTAAHHARLWNRRFSVAFKVPRRPASLRPNFLDQPAAERRLYNTLTMALHLLRTIDPNGSLQPFLYRTIEGLDSRFHPDMGFPADWRGRPLWSAYAPKTAAP